MVMSGNATVLGQDHVSDNKTAEDDIEIYAVVGILSVFAVTGTIGNAIAFYVFYNLKNKFTSTIFILALAGVDFITCLVTIPYTIAVEYLKFYVKYDSACKIYHFLITTTIPFSAFIMVAIAVDRYLCICHPFLHLMTIRRARVIVGCLSVFALSLGGMACVHYSVFKPGLPGSHINATRTPTIEYTPHSQVNVTGYMYGYLQPTDASRGNYSISSGLDHDQNTGFNISAEVYVPSQTELIEIYTGECGTRKTTIDPVFFMVFQKVYSSFFLICCVVVFILYSLIYRSVISQRQKRLRIKSQKCCLMWDAQNVDNEQSEVTVALELNHSTTNGESLKTRPDDSLVPENTQTQANSSRARLERMRLANIKTAAMLFVVTLVFILSFSPAWLMVHEFITMNVVFFYMYFIYNVVNPIIYAFMNNAFRVELRKMFRCESY